MEAMHINTRPCALLSEDISGDAASLLPLPNSPGIPAARQQAALEAGITSPGPAGTTKSALRRAHCPSPSSSSHLSLGSTSKPRKARLPPPSQFLSLRSRPVAPALSPAPSPSVALSVKDSHPRTAVSVTASSSPAPLLFGPNPRTPETSLVGASGEHKSSVENSTVAHRTSALREINSSFPSPVFPHNRHTKSTGAQSTTYSQPVIVRTYTGPSPSPSNSAHHGRPSSSNRTGSRIATSRRIPLVPSSCAAVSFPAPPKPAASSSDHAGGWRLTSSLFGMVRTKSNKGGFLAWPWTSASDKASAPDETKLPPLEAFTFQGFMADLQTTTDIRADLDRIAEICARSRYSLSNQYEAHMAPHGSGSGFAASAGQGRSKGAKKSASTPGGPTLQAVPSDDDEGSSRGQRRRRGGMGGGRRRSAAYGTLETIMSSSRSSEEDKTKKKPAAEIAEQVRGRPARKTVQADADTAPGETDSSGRERTSGSGSSRANHQKDASTAGKTKRDKGKAVQRPHAVMGSSRESVDPARVPANSSATPSSQMHASDRASRRRRDVPLARATPTRAHRPEPLVHIATAEEGFDGPAQPRSMPLPESAEPGFLSGLPHWIPWTAGSVPGALSQHERSTAPVSGPSHAEGSLRELLRSAEANNRTGTTAN